MELFAAFALFALLAIVLVYGVRSPSSGSSSDVGSSDAKLFFTKVAGVTKRTPDGESRQKIIKELSPGDSVELVREPENPHDSDAIKVIAGGEHIGYLPSRTATDLAREMDRGARCEALISDITGGERGKPTRGVNLQVRVFSPPRPSGSHKE
jgi:hypothetical protein